MNNEALRVDPAEALHCRVAIFKPETADENNRTVEAILATDKPNTSVDSRTGKGVYEVWRMDGCEYPDSVPLVDNHNRASVRNVLGSVSNIRTTADGQLMGTVRISEAEPNVWTKVREGHLRDVSGGIMPDEAESIQPGQTRHVRGVSYTAPHNREMKVLTRWRLREVSLTPIGADPAAKLRAEAPIVLEVVESMKESVRKFLEGIGLAKTATEDEAKAFYDACHESTRKLADESGCVVADEGSNRSELDAETIRSEAAKAERKRIADLERMGEGLPAETVRKAVTEGWTTDKAAPVFLDAMRNRTEAATPAIHSRNHDQDCTSAALGAAMAMRSCGGERLLSLNAQYEPATGKAGVGAEFVLRKANDREAYRKTYERVLNEADRYTAMSLVDICREACRLDGSPVNLRTSGAEVFRTAVSGSALAQIFTTNVNAQFLSGYADFADSTTGWCTESDVSNFLTNERDMMGKFGSLTKLAKGRPADHLNTSDWKESYKISRYAGQFVVDEQDILNDRFGALEQSPQDMGLTAAQIRPNLVYYIILANPNLDYDGGRCSKRRHTLRGANKGSGTALSATSIQSGLSVIAKQRLNSRPLNLRGRFLIVPQDLRWTADIACFRKSAL
jgi:hypothetical protein